MWTIAADNHQGKAFAALLVLFLIIAATLCGLRILSRRLHRHALDASDYMCFLALVLDIGLTVIIWGSFAHGYGQDITEFSLNDAKFASKLFIAIEVVWAAAAVSVRISIILLCICLFPVRLFRLVSWMVVGLNLATFLSTVLTACLICRPIFYSFDKTIPGGHCGDLMAFEDFQAIMSLLLDLTIVVLPLPLLWQLQMKRQKKIQLSVVFGTGLIIVLITLLRIILSKYYQPENFSKSQAVTAVITGLEPILGVSSACLPFIPQVFQHFGNSKLTHSLTDTLKLLTGRKTRGSNGTKGSQNATRSAHSGQYKGLSDIEMHPTKEGNFVSSVVSSGRTENRSEHQPWVKATSKDRIFMHKDYSVRSEPQRSGDSDLVSEAH